jgi:hypothetical protein
MDLFINIINILINYKMTDKHQIILMNNLKNILTSDITLNTKRIKIRKHFPLTIQNRSWEFDISNNKLYIKTNIDNDDFIFDDKKRFNSTTWSYSLLTEDTADVCKYIIDSTVNEINYFIDLQSKNNILGFAHIKKINQNEFHNYEEYKNTNFKEIYHFSFQQNQCNYFSFITNENNINLSNCIVYAVTSDNIINILFSYDKDLFIDPKINYIKTQIDKNNILNMIYSFGCFLGCNTYGETLLSNITQHFTFEMTFMNGTKYIQTKIPEYKILKNAIINVNKNLYNIYFKIIKCRYNWFIKDIIIIKNNDLKFDLALSFDFSTHFKIVLLEKTCIENIKIIDTSIRIIKEIDSEINIYMKNEDIQKLDKLFIYISKCIYSN